ncbi:SDR family NAD(P)-dependent oxidoreductase [Urechidicola vernalis]|uniref:SDR family NAD(P)-dependent oxidoreductase n=1 Tax=Urechidicola vernalis TaxID=3075600 RepID=A0ABU2Y2F5_9FLAO|nr:SDR family NAD(P)-dependent oxidoreductase [Urechidicola sp. P050]MDT0551996.1 SDR family NAD(P)-dependent oxidoreductase [Urechidicola sp. P050]
MNSKLEYAVITGASQGLGRAFALSLAEKGQNLILISLPNQKLNQLAKQIEEDHYVKTVYFELDFCSDKDVIILTKYLNSNFNVNILINNAGTGGTKRINDASLTYLNTIIQVNIKATTVFTHQLLPNLKKQQKSYILNVSSIAAFSPVGYKTVYPASKAFIHSFSIGLSEELKSSNVSVSVINPGAMKTNPEITARIEKQGIIGRLTLLDPKRVADFSIKKMFQGTTFILINPISWFIASLLPNKIKVPMMTNIVKREA